MANRFAQTQELIPSHGWQYIQSKEGRADCASRGILATELTNHPLWWSGPAWISLPPSNWPNIPFITAYVSNTEEVNQTPHTVLVSTIDFGWNNLFSKYSSWGKLQKVVVAFILRFIHNCWNYEKRYGFISNQELKQPERKIFKIVQKETFSKEIDHLKREKTCSTRLQWLSPFLSSQGLLRVRGQLS